ncbi:acyl-CoA carboxylase subunit epsilon [Streptomyces sp. MB09-01]|uniref:acyl-CoA carboxylase subunit epsilon n=1 Tax=Streptomyces sp. MB09-01 TaxID=3028666 RepID=UPI0029B57D7D|nr:acyl-CoA carboxylase subunit epsilon [Streptomyces sp. MB09-01]MDX3537341.1 acyl-CoA carboxylase subunit epsilon [Streptomyces sp. MB09-01]
MNAGILPHLIRIERGSLDEDEAAALVTVLLTRSQAATADPDASRGPGPGDGGARWARLERTRGFGGPRSWQRPR